MPRGLHCCYDAGSGGVKGYDGAKKIHGRKRHILVDSLGLLLAVVVTSAAVDDAAAAPEVLGRLTPGNFPRLKVIWADSKYHNHKPSHRLRAGLEGCGPDRGCHPFEARRAKMRTERLRVTV